MPLRLLSLGGEKPERARSPHAGLSVVPESHLFQFPRAGLCLACFPMFQQLRVPGQATELGAADL